MENQPHRHPGEGAQQHGHRHGHQHNHQDGGGTESEFADLLDLDADVHGVYLDEVTEWVRGHAPEHLRRVVDVGAGTGAGTLALARRFDRAEFVAIDHSTVLLDRLQNAWRQQGIEARLRVVEADLDVAWPEVGPIDLVWAASSLHHVRDPDQFLAALHRALVPGGLLVVVEMDALPRFLPDDIGIGRPGLEARCHEGAAHENWNAHPNWSAHLRRAGFDVTEERTFSIDVTPAPPSAVRYAQAVLGMMRVALAGRLSAEDVGTLDRLLTQDSPESLMNRDDLSVHGSRTAWSGRRP